MYVGQHMRDKIAPETFKKLVLIAVIAAGAELLRHGFSSVDGLAGAAAVGSSGAAAASRSCVGGGNRGFGPSRPSTLRRTSRQACDVGVRSPSPRGRRRRSIRIQGLRRPAAVSRPTVPPP